MHQGLIKAGQQQHESIKRPMVQTDGHFCTTCLDPHRPGPSGEGGRTRAREKREGERHEPKKVFGEGKTKMGGIVQVFWQANASMRLQSSELLLRFLLKLNRFIIGRGTSVAPTGHQRLNF